MKWTFFFYILEYFMLSEFLLALVLLMVWLGFPRGKKANSCYETRQRFSLISFSLFRAW